MRATTLPYAALALILTTGTGLVACNDNKTQAPAAPAAAAPAPAPSPFAQDSTLPYNLPPFDKIKDSDYAPAIEQGMAEQRKEVDAIAHSAEIGRASCRERV